MKNLKISFMCLVVALSGMLSCENEEEPNCESELNFVLTNSGKRRVIVDPNTNDQHIFYFLNVAHTDESCKTKSKPVSIQLTSLYSPSEAFENPTEHFTNTIAVPTMASGELEEIPSLIDFRETGYYKIQWKIDAPNAIAETNEEDNTVVIDKFYLFVR